MDFFAAFSVAALGSLESFIRIFHFYIFSQVTFYIKTDFQSREKDRVEGYERKQLEFPLSTIFFCPWRDLFWQPCSLPLFYTLYRTNNVNLKKKIVITNFHRVTFWFPSFIRFFGTLPFSFFRVTSVNWENSHFIACNIFNFPEREKRSTDGFFCFPYTQFLPWKT